MRVMPAPYGSSPRSESFLLRMTKEERAFVAGRARAEDTSINRIITTLIRREMARYDRPPAPPAPPAAEAPPAPQDRPRPARRVRPPTVSTADRAKHLLPPPVEPVEGQEPFPGTDQ